MSGQATVVQQSRVTLFKDKVMRKNRKVRHTVQQFV